MYGYLARGEDVEAATPAGPLIGPRPVLEGISEPEYARVRPSEAGLLLWRPPIPSTHPAGSPRMHRVYTVYE